MYVAGDVTTPHDAYLALAAEHDGVVYLRPEDQEKVDGELSRVIGWRTVQRRNFATLAAWRDGAEVFAFIDDDNVPKDYSSWGENLLLGPVTCNEYI